ncbi:ribonuclease H-like domain-containing protein [candidate division KSB1 bacterium]
MDKEFKTLLECSYIHIPGIQDKTEVRIWEMGILSWDDMEDRFSDNDLPFKNTDVVKSYIGGSKSALEKGNIRFFKENFPKREYWRFYPAFKDKTLFLDIETNGLSKEDCEITVIGTLYQGTFRSFVSGVNLQEIVPLLEESRLIVTYNGDQFDIPFLEKAFSMDNIPYVSLDLRWILKRLGYSGGLKSIEEQLDIKRPDYLKGVSGHSAVMLWEEYKSKKLNALNILRRYCLEDVKNLIILLHIAYNKLLIESEFPGANPLPELFKWAINIDCDYSLIDEIKKKSRKDK